MQRAVFLDRDGVLVEDQGLLSDSSRIRLLDGVPQALRGLAARGFELVVVTNQPIVARGLAGEDQVVAVHDAIRKQIEEAGGPTLKHFYFCPHHPRADVQSYRLDCECRKPKPGLLRRAAEDHGLHLAGSFMVGDRISDVIAGASAGCHTVLVESGRHLDPPIETSVPMDPETKPEFVCADLASAADWILAQ